jgi:ABC-2 type transport system ATP-binding protein
MQVAVLELVGLGKDYGERTAVKSVDLVVNQGEIFGLLGPNGAGKTTTISAACGVIAPSRGTARVGGHDLQRDEFAAKRLLGLVPQDLALYEDLSAQQNLAFFGQLYELSGEELAARIDWALGIAELADRRHEIVKKFSGGMKRRLNLAIGVLHKPRLLILDEPTVGVDPQSRRHIFDSIRALRDQGMTIIYTSHYMEEVEELCDRVAIMDAGQVVASGTLAELSAAHGGGDVQVELDGTPEQLDAAAASVADLGATRKDGVLSFAQPERLAPIVAAIEATGTRITRVGSRRTDLETVFLALTGRGLRDAS